MNEIEWEGHGKVEADNCSGALAKGAVADQLRGNYPYSNPLSYSSLPYSTLCHSAVCKRVSYGGNSDASHWERTGVADGPSLLQPA